MQIEVMTTTEEVEFRLYEQEIRQGLDAFYRVGCALAAIRDKRLYRMEFGTFEDYCRERWGIAGNYAYKLIASSTVTQNLSLYNCTDLPETESQARELAPLNDQPELQREAWQRAIETAPEGKITAAHVREVVAQMTDDERKAVRKISKEVALFENERQQRDNLLKFPAGDFDTCTVDDLEKLVANGARFGTLYLDPPWSYGNQATRSATDNHYPTMMVEEIAALPIADLAAEQSHIYLWTTNAFLHESFHLLEHWGFEYKSLLVWDKEKYGIGNYWRLQTEYLLLATKGGLGVADKNNRNILREESSGHSVKPHVVRKMIEAMSPGPRLELFARRVATGWTCWGNEIERTMFDYDLKEVA